eukprot:XP_016658811.1 PREDICTED: uncharacterized protein LOC107883398 [Acyrthosiphon pisum]
MEHNGEYKGNDEIANVRKVTEYVRKIESNRSVKISKQELHNMILYKAAEVMATHDKSNIAKQMVNKSICEEEQRSYYEKYKQLLNHVNTISSELELLNRVPDDEVKHVRNVGTQCSIMPAKKKPL